MRKTALVTVIMLAFALVVFAHGTDKHIIGTVTKISETEVTVQTLDNQLQIVKIAPDTSFVKSGAASSIKELKVGERVVIHAKPVGNDLIAHEVRFGKPAPPAAKSE
jgi:Domain of unknown function (DUF5666)